MGMPFTTLDSGRHVGQGGLVGLVRGAELAGRRRIIAGLLVGPGGLSSFNWSARLDPPAERVRVCDVGVPRRSRHRQPEA